jgi:hypothetical protein
MAQPVYSIVIYAKVGLVGTQFKTVPAGFRWVVRDVDCYYNGLEVCTVRMIGVLGQTVWVNEFAGGGAGPQYASWRGRFVVNAGNKVSFDASNAADFSVSGYQLTLP